MLISLPQNHDKFLVTSGKLKLIYELIPRGPKRLVLLQVHELARCLSLKHLAHTPYWNFVKKEDRVVSFL